jgi:hypothetical protein
MAKPAAEVAPDVYKVVFENERLRLLEVRMAPGAASELHSHRTAWSTPCPTGRSGWLTRPGKAAR